MVSLTPPSPCAWENDNLISQLKIKPPLHLKPKGSRQIQQCYSNMLGVYSENIVSTSLHLSSKNKRQRQFSSWRVKPPSHVLINYIHHPSIIKQNPFKQYRTLTTDALKTIPNLKTKHSPLYKADSSTLLSSTRPWVAQQQNISAKSKTESPQNRSSNHDLPHVFLLIHRIIYQ